MKQPGADLSHRARRSAAHGVCSRACSVV